MESYGCQAKMFGYSRCRFHGLQEMEEASRVLKNKVGKWAEKFLQWVVWGGGICNPAKLWAHHACTWRSWMPCTRWCGHRSSLEREAAKAPHLSPNREKLATWRLIHRCWCTVNWSEQPPEHRLSGTGICFCSHCNAQCSVCSKGNVQQPLWSNSMCGSPSDLTPASSFSPPSFLTQCIQ